MHQPRVLFLDEPTTGVDPVSRKEFWDILSRLKAKGMTMFVSTPYMDEASRCDRVALIEKGRILTVDPPAAIVSRFPHPLLAVRAPGATYRLLQELRLQPWAHSVFPFGAYVHLALSQPTSTQVVQQQLAMQGFKEVEVLEITPGIEDCFMELMHDEARTNGTL